MCFSLDDPGVVTNSFADFVHGMDIFIPFSAVPPGGKYQSWCGNHTLVTVR